VDEKTRKMLNDNVENPWDFVVEAAKRYKKEFIKTSKIGRPPAIDEVMGEYIKEIVEGPEENKEDTPDQEKDIAEEDAAEEEKPADE